MNLPTEKQCLDYFEQYKVPKNIFQHCLKVREVAMFLAQELKKSGMKVNFELLDCLALLHDLFKAATLKQIGQSRFHPYQHTPEEIEALEELKKKYPHKYEGEIAYEVFKDQYPELALSLKNCSDPNSEHSNNEEKIAHYADVRVFKEEVILLHDRFQYLREAYPKPIEYWDIFEEKNRKLEEQLFKELSFKPVELKDKLEIYKR